MIRRLAIGAAALLGLAASAARADAVDALREFAREVKSARAEFTQTVTSADGARQKVSSGEFEFQRPNRFRFAYQKPFEQLIVADGQKVWIYDADLNQASSRAIARALGATPAALLAGGAPDADFTLVPEASRDGVDWVRATPKAARAADAGDGTFKSMRIGFRGKELVAVEVVDAFGQRSRLQFTGLVTNPALAAERFRFVPPAGADVVEQ